MKTFIISIAMSLLTLGWTSVSTATAETETQVRAPAKVRLLGPVSRDGRIVLEGSTEFPSTCFSYGDYNYKTDGTNLVIQSFVQADRESMCLQYINQAQRLYEIRGLNPAQTYQVYFANADGEWIYFGPTN